MSNQGGIKQYILSMKKQIDSVRKNDSKAKRLQAELDEQSAEIRQIYSQLQRAGNLANGKDEQGNELDVGLEITDSDRQANLELFNLLNTNMEQLVKLNKLTQKDYSDHMGRKFPDFKKTYPGLFDRLLEGDLDSETLTHVLDTLTMVEQGHIDLTQGRNMGLDFLTQKFDLPQDFFDKNREFLGEEDE